MQAARQRTDEWETELSRVKERISKLEVKTDDIELKIEETPR
jgi:predicted  nucleic acid-binding Zn-ribbon protein